MSLLPKIIVHRIGGVHRVLLRQTGGCVIVIYGDPSYKPLNMVSYSSLNIYLNGPDIVERIIFI